VSVNDGTTPVSYTYDGSGNLIQRTDGSGTTTYTYDNANRLLTRGNTAGGKTLTYTYDPVGNLAGLSDGGGSRTYSYDSRNLLTSMTTGNGALYTFSYDADGRRTATYFNTVTGNATWAARTLTTYDKSGAIARITTALNSAPADLVSDISYCYSPLVSGQSCPASSSSTDKGLLQYATDNMTGTVTVYTYDQGNRLIKATNVAGHTYGYGYDADGNRTSVTTDGTATQSLACNSANQASSSGYGYDQAGNLTATPGASYSYNAAEQMTSSTVNGTTTPHAYAGGTQQELTSSGGSQFVWGRDDQHGQPWLQSFNTNSQGQVYVERDGYGTPLGLHTGGNDYYLVLDNLGSVIAVVNSAGSVVARYSYDPYGNTVSADESGLGKPNVIRYTGGVLDQSTGLTKLGQRYDNPGLGAFTQQDASQILANPGNGNLYAYAGDNPVNYTDPTGQNIWGDVVGGVLAAAGAVLAVSAVVALPDILVVAAAVVAIAALGLYIYQMECKYLGAGSMPPGLCTVLR
jgi:RHS repeat-associated protein